MQNDHRSIHQWHLCCPRLRAIFVLRATWNDGNGGIFSQFPISHNAFFFVFLYSRYCGRCCLRDECKPPMIEKLKVLSSRIEFVCSNPIWPFSPSTIFFTSFGRMKHLFYIFFLININLTCNKMMVILVQRQSSRRSRQVSTLYIVYIPMANPARYYGYYDAAPWNSILCAHCLHSLYSISILYI